MLRSPRSLVPWVAAAALVGALARAVDRDQLPPADFTFVSGAEVKSLDPAIVAGHPENIMLNGLFQGLVRWEPENLDPVPGVAESWEISEDGLTYAFHLRDDARWSDGTPVTAEDFRYSLRRFLDPRTAAEYAYQAWYIPFIFVVIFIITILNDDAVAQGMRYYGIDKIAIFFFVVGAIYWLTMARVVRGQVILLKTEPFIEAARSLGAGATRIVFRHVFPNVLSIVLVYLTLSIPRVMLFEAFLSFLGLGVEPPDVSWGLLAKDGIEALTPVRVYWWLVLFPSLALSVTLLALNFLGDGLRDAFDPRLRDR